MAEYEFKKDKTLHTLLIQLVLFFIIIGIYFSLKVNAKIIDNPMSMPICLLGSYILLNAFSTFVHCKYHEYHKITNSNSS